MLTLTPQGLEQAAIDRVARLRAGARASGAGRRKMEASPAIRRVASEPARRPATAPAAGCPAC